MPFPFSEICTLLQRLEDIETRSLLLTDKAKSAKEVVESWFKSHRGHINQLTVDGSSALLSALLPEWRTDRVYSLQQAGLSKVISRSLGLGVTNRQILEAYKKPGYGDLGLCLERLLKAGGCRADPPVMLEEVDSMLQNLAGMSPFSDPSIPKLSRSSSEMQANSVGYILNRLGPQEGKWLVRLILKNFSPLRVDETLILKNFHFLLPDLLRCQRNFRTAVALIKDELQGFPSTTDWRSEKGYRAQVDERHGVRPIVGTKIARPNFHKARGVDSLLKMLGEQNWVVERKYDGEYCEIHVDLTKSPDPIQCIKIFSKSGKDSTQDRKAILPTLIEALRLGKEDCRFKKHAIILGELVVFSDEEDCVMPFEEIRKHVMRSGRRLGADEDSQPKAHEHLAIVFFDLLLLDDEIIMKMPVEERRMWLREAYKKRHGYAIGAEWKTIDFSDSRSKKRLVDNFGASIARRCEGLILKPCGIPYFSMEFSNAYNRSYIKVKKDYINGHGDEGDFAVIGASYQAQLAGTTGISNVKWTSFHLGCLTNKEEVRRVDARPIFRYVDTIEHEHCIPKAILQAANSLATFVESPYDREQPPRNFDIESSQPLKMDVVLDTPLVFEVLGSGFEKPSNCRFLMLRHPRVEKLHEDRTWRDCITFQELQEQGNASRASPEDSESQETRRWVERIEISAKRKYEREKTASPRRRATSTPTSSAMPLSQRESPTRLSAVRVIDALPTPFPSSGARRVLGPAVLSPPVLVRRDTGIKRQHEDTTEAQALPPKRHCVHPAKEAALATPPSSDPLAEVSGNADTGSAVTTTRLTRRPRELFEFATKLVSRAKSITNPESQPDVVASTATCASSRCPFSNAVLVLSSCIANTPYITENLLCLHNTTTTSDISHWDRDSFAHEPLTEIVSESQAFPGMRKIVLVEAKRHAAARSMVQQILQLNEGRFKERVEVYDWRVLEECQRHKKRADELKEHFIGATVFDDTQKRALFASNCDWIEV